MSFSIVVPAVAASNRARRPAYISPSTRSVSFAIGGAPPQVVALIPGSATCPASGNTYTCTATANVAAGTAALTVAAYASADGSGPALSQNQLTVTVIADKNNPITVTLNGVAAGFTVGVNPASITEGTPASITVTWAALDASGNTIVGPGSIVNANGAAVAPSLSVSDAANFKVGAPSGNSWPVAYNGAATSSPVTFTVAGAGVPMASATAAVNPAGQRLFVQSNDGSISVFDPPYTGTPVLITSGLGTPETGRPAVDAALDVFVPNFFLSTVTMYAPPYSGPPAVTISLPNPYAVALDSSGNLFVAAGTAVKEFAPPYTGAPAATINDGVTSPNALAVDPSGDLFVSDGFNDRVTVSTPPYTAAPKVITSPGCPPLPCLSPTGFGLAVVPGTSEVVFTNDAYATTGYTSPYVGSMPAIDIANGANNGATGLAIDPSGDIFIAYTHAVAEFKPPYTGAASVLITQGIDFPYGLSLDHSGNLFVANFGSGIVTEYAPPYTQPPATIHPIESAGSVPFWTALSP